MLGFVWIPIKFGVTEKEVHLHVIDKDNITFNKDETLGNFFALTE